MPGIRVHIPPESAFKLDRSRHQDLIKAGEQGTIKKLWKQSALCRRLRLHEKASVLGKGTVASPSYHAEAFSATEFVNNPG